MYRYVFLIFFGVFYSALSFAAKSSVQMWELKDAHFLTVDGKEKTFAQIKHDIYFGASSNGWSVVEESANSVTLQRSKINWSVDVLLTFDAKSFSVKYLRSENLGYEVESDGTIKIHPNYNIWVQRLVRSISPSVKGRNLDMESPLIAEDGMLVLHYRRPQGDYENWGMYYWGDVYDSQNTWFSPLMPSGEDGFGVYFKLRMNSAKDVPEDAEAYFVMHKGDTKEICTNNMFWDHKKSREIYVTSGDCSVHYSKEEAINSRYFR